MDTQYFLFFVEQLRQQGHVVLYNNILAINEEECRTVELFLEAEYEKEALNFPFEKPDFDKNAALYAANTMYKLAQLLLFRQHNETDLEKILLPYQREQTASAIISADLLFRFLNTYRTQFSLIDYADAILPIVDQLGRQWHFSAMPFIKEVDGLLFDPIVSNACLKQLYVDRIIACKNKALADLPFLKPEVESVLGIYQKEFWNNYS